ncbi:MAG: hypothetical protein A2Y15_04235 [Clostridiales bacterium GWF2_36_10]|nr:MAG: hypothetical protein A2Y15_04235 [Clostridiales bacterium GWF2_36_10]HAN20514.1 hypothetical protein [Clostridiales bacterium]
MRIYITSFCNEFEYPDEATLAFSDAYDQISNNIEAFDIFQNQVELYNNDQLTNHGVALEDMDKVAEITGVHKYTVHLLFYICLSHHTRELYKEKNIAYDIFYDSMSDLKWKLFECKKVYDIWGSFVAWWFGRFFDLTRFAIGRLQFETYEFGRTYSKNGLTIKPNNIVLNVHIPSCGPMKHEDCLASYKKAAEFYKDVFKDRPVVFICCSWLLYPAHREFLPASSNILAFMSDYDIIESSIDEEGSFMWRIYETMDFKDMEKLPCDTSLRRAYYDWLSKGNKGGSGFGVFVYNK